MICTVCGTENEKGFKFCVKCGSNLENPDETNYEQVDMGNYHSEEEGENSGFTMDTGTFVIRDTAPPPEQNIYTADELNQSEEDFDFSIYDEPSMASLTPPTPQPTAPQQVYAQPQPPVQGMNQFMTQQPMMYAQPQIIGYDPTGMPIYGQPQGMMFPQPQIIGYDPNGMPIYGQPQGMMFPQPQIIGYDANGVPIYGQPQGMMFPQPQIIGYDPNGIPIYGQPNFQPMGGIPVPNQGAAPNMQGTANFAAQNVAQAAEPPKRKEYSDFWSFFDNGSGERHESSDDDFFCKAKSEPIISDDPFADIDNRRKKRLQAENAAQGFMSDTPIVDGDQLAKNDSDRINKLYMRQTGNSVSSDLTVGGGRHKNGTMAAAGEVNADMLAEKLNVRSRVSMQYADEINADGIEAYVPEHREAIMAQADHAVEAMPKKIDPYQSELDKIELPEYMQAKKTAHEDTAEIPSLPEV
ncbi:MAG: hypothetical protein J6B75_05470 [Ruminococcus sp.]|nr:hypothetical protein [Ruminococcus sp.]